ncbi:GntR family transcriptional regulator [Paenibacillus protaetiae]|uniref:GntR family transcriptional regulator n=1 Tax=Paenibacillus protaetiae TaxID=2509456 RepID=A0A4P6ES21_9BACL|nr:GntR family transcriptional regulator [Paenibacillus protaetiae]QAY65225.1 GntR family transcriptional regulator [Paenibacillus protaetiae]
MADQFDNHLPIYMQIMDLIKKDIISGQLMPGDKIPSVRELAAELQINPNTIQRALQELEREEIVESKRGMGRYVTGDQAKITGLKKEKAGELLSRFVQGMQELGFHGADIVSIVAGAVQPGPLNDKEGL